MQQPQRGTVMGACRDVWSIEGGGARQVVVVGIEASTAAGIASTAGAGANTKGSRFIHFIFAVGVEASTPVGTPTAIVCAASIVVCAGASVKGTKEGSEASHVAVSCGTGIGTSVGNKFTVVCARGNPKATMEGSGASHVTVAVGVDATIASGTASTVVCSGAYTNGSGSSHGIVTVGIKASTPVGTASSVICAGANASGGGVSHGTVCSFETSSSACIVCTSVGAGSRSKVTKEGIGASHVIVTAGIDARSAAGTASTGVCSGASPPSLW